MKKFYKYKILLPLIVIIVAMGFFFLKHKNPTRPVISYLPEPQIIQDTSSDANINNTTDEKINFVGPRQNIPDGTPKDEGFWSFAYTVPGVLSRSGQPTIEEFRWLKEHGWKSDINLRIDGDHNEQADDSKIPGFNTLGFKYLHLQIVDGAAPTDQQGEQFLQFVTNPENLPAHVHCRGGIGRAGTMVALYRYSVQGWPMNKAIQESRKFRGGVSNSQKKWLNNWAANHEPGSYRK